MKKLLIILAAVALCLSFASCTKKCECKLWALGVAGEPYEVELENGKKCKDMTLLTVTGDFKSGVECK